MIYIHIDAETKSEVVLPVREGGVGTFAYTQHPSTEAILWSITMLGETTAYPDPDVASCIAKAIGNTGWDQYTDEATIVHWGPFDRLLAEAGGFKHEHWLDLMSLSMILGGPAALEHAAKFWAGLEKGKDAKPLMKLFGMPPFADPEDHPQEWADFVAYAEQDTRVMPAMLDAMMSVDPLAWEGHEQYVDMVDRMNRRGAPVDDAALRDAIIQIGEATEPLVDRCIDICGLRPTQLQALKTYLGLPNMQAPTVEEFLEDPNVSDEHREVAEIQQAVGGAAHKKVYSLSRMSVDGRVHFSFVYPGAVTRRLTSKDAQLHNMKRAPYDPAYFEGLANDSIDPLELIGDTRRSVRGFIKAPPEKILIAADYAAIECRITNWLSGEEWVLDLFRAGGDPYTATANDIGRHCIGAGFDIDPSRQFGKACELGLGFAGGKAAVVRSGKTYGLVIPSAVGLIARDVYRETHPNVVDCWAQCNGAMLKCIDSAPGMEVSVNNKIWFQKHAWGVKTIRPSGFGQYWYDARIEVGHWDDGGERDEIRYTGRHPQSGRMMKLSTYGGHIFQNNVQGCAADLMYEGMLYAEECGFPPIMSVHDEDVVETSRHGDTQREVNLLCSAMAKSPWWADGLPIKAEGWHDERFTKG